MKLIVRTVIGLCIVLAVVMAIGTHSIWSFKAYPVTTLAIQRPVAVASPATTGTPLLAGIAERDITTPIGIPKMGYSAWARDADGFRTRLKARAFYLKSAGHAPVVVVQADLPASSLVLRHAVAERVARVTDVPFSALSIHATHTHSGPGQYFESDFYNNFGSNRPGFDPDVFNFLVTRISDAVIEAWTLKRPARIAVGQTVLYGATRNRSIEAYVQNLNVTDKRTDEAAELRAVNPLITLVRIDALADDGKFLPWGAFSTFAIHGTAIPPFTHPYHGDVWAFFERDLERRISEHYQPPWKPVHGPFEANHGDNNPNYVRGLRGDRETRRIGMRMARQAWTLFQSLDGKGQDDLPLYHGMREVNLLAPGVATRAGLCERALVGAATVGAAHGDEVFPVSYIPPFRPGWPKEGSDHCHAQKQWMLSWLQVWGVEPWRYPHWVNATVVRIGEVLMVGLPFEITFESGNRIAAAVSEAASAAGMQAPRVVVSSHTNGFFGYSTTREEYARQHYEGGHTLYGPGTSDFLANLAAGVASDMIQSPGVSDLPDAWTFSLATRRHGPDAREVTGARAWEGDAVFRNDDGLQEAHWRWVHLDVPPGLMDLHEPLLSIETRQGDSDWMPLRTRGQPVDDQGTDLQLRLLEDPGVGMARYEVRWYNPPVSQRDQQFRVVVAPRGGLERSVSPPVGAVGP